MNAASNTRRVLVTGGSSGIGQAIARRLTQSGWQVINFDRQAPAPGEAARHVMVDMADEQALQQALSALLADGPVLGLVNNVAAIRPASLQAIQLADFDRQISVTARAALQCAQALVPGMASQRFGRIVNISSRAALGKELRSGYAAAKGALNALTRTWALELAGEGITVNAVAPGPIATAAFEAANPADSVRTQRIVQGMPVGRLGRPEDVAHAVLSFMHEDAGFITGQTLYVCGGITTGLAP